MDAETQEIIDTAIQNKDVKVLSDALFDIELMPSQERIVRNIAFDENKYVAITAATQYGKTWAVAIGICLYIILHEDKDILLMSGTREQATIARDKVAEFVAESPILRDLVDSNAEGVDRLKKEVSKNKITFKNGCILQVLTAGGKNAAQSLMGHAGDLNVVDESNLVEDSVFEKRIFRMAGKDTNASIVEIGNPTSRNHFFENFHHDPDYETFRIGWRKAVEEGSFDKSFVDKMREKLSEREFRIQYEARFPEEDADESLINYTWIKDAVDRTIDWSEGEADRVVYGLDVARGGTDYSVLIRVESKDGRVGVREGDVWKYDVDDTMTLTNKVISCINEREEANLEDDQTAKDYIERINVDATGIGGGVQDRLEELGWYAAGFKAGAAAGNRDRFLYQKDEKYWKLRTYFEDDYISIPDHKKLRQELNDMKETYNSKSRMRVEDPAKSPDFSDALMVALSRTRNPSGGTGSVRQKGV